MKRILILILAGMVLIPGCQTATFAGEQSPKVEAPKSLPSISKAATPPQALLDALEKVEQDRLNLAVADAEITAAKSALETASSKRITAAAAMAVDQAAFLKLWAELYGPTPAPEPTPDPTPDPDPDPTPDPQPPPTPCKLRVLMLYDSSALGTMSEAQRQMLASCKPGDLKAWLADHCLTQDGLPEWRCWATDVPCSEPRWQALVDAGNGQKGFVIQAGESGPISRIELPTDSTAAIEALGKIANPAGKRLVISDANYRQFLDLPGHGTGYIKPPGKSRLPRFSATYKIIPRSQWKQLVAEGRGTFLGDLMRANRIPCKDQDGTNYCWAYASVACVEVIRALQGQPYIDLSAESVAGPVRNWRNQGGWGLEALDQLASVGACRADFMDSPNSLSPRRWKTGWEDDCANHKIVAAWASIDDDGFDGVFTAALLRLPVSIGLDWWSHQVTVVGPVVLDNGGFGVECRNSWGSDYGDDGYFVLTESKAQPSGSFACISVGSSDRAFNAKTRGTVVDLVRLRQRSVEQAIRAARRNTDSSLSQAN